MNKRHLTWVRRCQTKPGEKAPWKPVEIHRLAAKHWIERKDKMIRKSTSWPGLVRVKHDPTKDLWAAANWRRWPHITAVQDRGSDGRSGIMACKFKPSLALNVTEWYDESHDLDNDILNCFKKHKLFPFVLICCLVINLPHGTQKDPELRFSQVQEMMSGLFANFTATSCASFQANMADMWKAMQDVVPIEDGQSQMEALWDYVHARSPYSLLGAKVDTVRFLSWLAGNRLLLKAWPFLRWKLQVLCSELGFCDRKNMDRLLLNTRHVEGEAARTSTDQRALPMDVKIERSACQNAAVISLLFLEEAANRRLLAVMTNSAAPALDHLGKHSKDCRHGVGGCQAWARSFVQGAFMMTLKDFWEQLERPSALDACLFFEQRPEETDVDTWMAIEDEWAAKFASFTMLFIANRCRRKAFMFGYPHRFVLLTDDGPAILKQTELDIFRTRYDSYQALLRRPPSAAVDAHRHRSQFKCVDTQQFLQGCLEHGWVFHKEIAEVADEHTSCALNTMPAEELIGVGKNSKKVRGSRVFRRPPLAFAKMIGSQTLGKRHRFDEMVPQSAMPAKKMRLAPTEFGHVKGEACSIDLDGVASRCSQAAWYSPAAPALGENTADHHFHTYLAETNQWEAIGNGHLGRICRCAPVIFRRQQVEGHADLPFDYHVGLFAWGDTSCTAWPVELVAAPYHKDDAAWALSFRTKAREPVQLSILSWDNLVGRHFRWRSPASLKTCWPRAGGTWHAAIRAMVDTAEDKPLKVLAAEAAWWDFDLGELHSLAPHVGCRLDKEDTLFQACRKMTAQVLGMDDDDVLQHLQARLAEDEDPEAIDELLEVDKAATLLHPTDAKGLGKAKADAQKRLHDANEFKRDLAAARAKARARAEAAKKHKGDRKAARPRLPVDIVPDHATAKRYSPPGSYVWRAFAHGGWEGRNPPQKTMIERWNDQTPAQALRKLLVRLWAQHCTTHGVQPRHCPLLGVFD